MAIKANLEMELEMGVVDLDTEADAKAACEKLSALPNTKATHKEHRILIQSSRKDAVMALANGENWKIQWIVGLQKKG